MAIDAKLVKKLRDQTGAGMMDCKNALTETNGDLEKAIDHLRKPAYQKLKKGIREQKMVWFTPTFMQAEDSGFYLS